MRPASVESILWRGDWFATHGGAHIGLVTGNPLQDRNYLVPVMMWTAEGEFMPRCNRDWADRIVVPLEPAGMMLFDAGRTLDGVEHNAVCWRVVT